MENEKKQSEGYDSKVVHEYDGIQEQDNRLPRWWLATFYITILFSVYYYAYYELGPGVSIQQEYTTQLGEIQAAQLAKNSASHFPDAEKLSAAQKNPNAGKPVYIARCVACHAATGGGGIGPNLTDNFWINGDGKATSVAQVIHDGVPAKGMPPWGPVLSEEEIYDVTSFILSLKGTNPPGAKAPQGNSVN